MDVRTFADELLSALTHTGLFKRVALQAEGPIADGYAYTEGDVVLRFYFNQLTGTIAFALIEDQRRIWGIDYDNRRGWHVHPKAHPEDHVAIGPLTVGEIVSRLQTVLANIDKR